MRDRFTVLTGVVLVAVGALWLLDATTGIEIPLELVLPVALIALGVILMLGRSDGGTGPGAPPSQFEREDAPRVP